MTSEDHTDRYQKGIARFNDGDYFDSHEIWEELWIDEGGHARRFYQGLIQAAVALHHLGNGNAVGSRKLMESSAAYLDGYRPEYLGLDLDRFLSEMRACFEANIGKREGIPGDLTNRPRIRFSNSSAEP